jgi:hypothetical protein
VIVWMIWLQEDDMTWLGAAWDDNSIAETPKAWDTEVERCRKLAYDNKYEMRIQSVKVPGVYELFDVPSVTALPSQENR